jgi:hypothetical protein
MTARAATLGGEGASAYARERSAGVRRMADFLENAGLQRPNPLLYRCFPLTCARSQE